VPPPVLLRLQADVYRSNAELYEARLDLSQCRCLLARAEEDLDGSRRCHEQVLTELRLELAHQRELVEAYQQVTTAQKRIASFTSQGSATKRPWTKLQSHMCAKHGLLRGAGTAPDACFRELHWKAV